MPDTWRHRSTALAAVMAGMASLLVAAAPATPGAPPPSGETTSGDCLSVSVYTRTGGGPNEYVLGPDHCVVGTGWTEAHRTNPEVGGEPLPVVGVEVGIPLPD